MRIKDLLCKATNTVPSSLSICASPYFQKDLKWFKKLPTVK